MNELITITKVTINNEEVNAVNARELHEKLGSKQDYSTWIKRRIEKYEFIEGQDYLLHKFVEQLPSGAKHCIEYIISLDMAKELAMVENNEQGRKVRHYFIEVEKRYRQSPVSNATIRQIAETMMPVLEEQARLKMELEFARHFLPQGKPGELNEQGHPKNQFRRGYYTSGKGKSITALIERAEQPGLFDEIELRQIGNAI